MNPVALYFGAARKDATPACRAATAAATCLRGCTCHGCSTRANDPAVASRAASFPVSGGGGGMSLAWPPSGSPSWGAPIDATRRAKRGAYRRMLAAIDAHIERTGPAAGSSEPLPAGVLGPGPRGST